MDEEDVGGSAVDGAIADLLLLNDSAQLATSILDDPGGGGGGLNHHGTTVLISPSGGEKISPELEFRIVDAWKKMVIMSYAFSSIEDQITQ